MTPHSAAGLAGTLNTSASQFAYYGAPLRCRRPRPWRLGAGRCQGWRLDTRIHLDVGLSRVALCQLVRDVLRHGVVMTKIRTFLKRLAKNEDGGPVATMAMLLVLCAGVAGFVILAYDGDALSTFYYDISRRPLW